MSSNQIRNRKMIIIRHGERVDHKFQDEWIEKCFDKNGRYARQNINQPVKLPPRTGFPQNFIHDSPLTEVGLFQATLRGQGLKAANILQNDFEIYISPALRCAQTATNMLKAMDTTKELKIEPSLFEWTQIQWYLNGMPKWMSNQELLEAGFLIDTTYVPSIPKEDMRYGESLEDYYSRSYNFVSRIVKDTDKDIVLIGHGFSAEVCTRQLLGYPIRTEEEMHSVVRHVPYVGMVILEENLLTKKWEMLPLPSKLQLHHKSAHEFNAKETFNKD